MPEQLTSPASRARIGAGVAAVVLLGVVAVGGFALGHHAGNGSSDTVGAIAGRAEATTHDTADVRFAAMMVPHHEQALAMVRLADGRARSRAVTTLAGQISTAQTAELATMKGWLAAWGTSPDTGRMTGMMSQADMDQLATLTGADFDRQFLTMMIQHHQGALEMARDELSHGENADALALAASIEVSQEAQIAQMRDLLS